MANTGYRRADRVEVTVQRGISEILTRDLPEDLPALVTVTSVKMTADLRHANVFFACYSSDPILVEKTFAKLQEYQPLIRRALPRYAPMKYVPELHFEADNALAYGSRVVGELGRLVEEAEARRDGDGDGQPRDS